MSRDRVAARTFIDDAARTLMEADITLGDPHCDMASVERRLLGALELLLNALAALRGSRSR